MIRHLLFTSIIIAISCIDSLAVKPSKFSSPSTTRRILEMEKSQEFKTFKKQIKKRFPEIKDAAVEEWSDGVKYYVFYCENPSTGKDDFIGLMRTTDSVPMFSLGSYKIKTFPNLEINEVYGHKIFRVTDSEYLFYNGEAHSFNPVNDIKEYGGKKYVVTGNNPTYVFAMDGTRLLMNDSFEFRDAVPAGFTNDTVTGLSIYHPALPPRFFGMTKSEYLAEHGTPVEYSLGFRTMPNSTFCRKVPGGEYFISTQFPTPPTVRSEIRQDVNGNMHEYRVYESGRKYATVAGNMTLCYHGGITGHPILSGNMSRIKISTPDQIAYYTIYDDSNRFYRTGCISLVDTTFRIPPRFADVNVFYDGDKKPYALVRLSSLGQYELYDPNKTYDYSEMSKLEGAYEQEYWSEVINQIKTSKIEDFKEENLMVWFRAETENLNQWIGMQEEALNRFLTGTLSDYERELLVKEANGVEKPAWYIPIHFSSDFDLDDVFEYFAKKYTGDKADNYNTLASYIRDLRKRKIILDDEFEQAKQSYIASIKDSQRQLEIAKQQQALETIHARQDNEARQQAVMLQLLGAISTAIAGVTAPSATHNTKASPAQSVKAAPMPTYSSGSSMLDRTYISPEIMGMAISAGWTPESPAAEPQTKPSSSSRSTSSRICHACYGSGKCPHCHGAGHYAPNLNGHHIECTSCHKSGICHSCNGTGHH